MKIYVDADACPVKAEVVRVAERHELSVVFVANSWMRLPEGRLVERIVVEEGADAADDWIASNIGQGDIAISADIPLASRCIKAGGKAIGPTGKPFSDANIGMALATSIGMALGIVVDDTVHFLSKFLRAKREQNLSNEDAVRYAFSTVGIALWVTSFVLVAGFLVLGMSSFAMNADRGLMAALAISIALIIDFIFLPTLLLGKSKTTNSSTVLEKPNPNVNPKEA